MSASNAYASTALDVSGLSDASLTREGMYRANVAYKVPYGGAVLLKLAESSADGSPLAVWIAASVCERLDLSRIYRNRDYEAQRAAGTQAPMVVVAGSFRRHPKLRRLSLDALDPSQISLR